MDETKSINNVIDYWNKNPIHSIEFNLSTDIITLCKRIDTLRMIEHERWARGRFHELKGEKGTKVLDAGCGIGVFTRYYGKKDFEVHAIDISPKAIEITKLSLETLGLKGEVNIGNVENISYPDSYFDYVVSNGVIHHTPNTEKAVEEFYRVLKPGGRASVSIYYKNIFLRYPIFNIVKPLLPLILKRTKLMGREKFLSALTPEEFVRVYDGDNNPIAKVYSRKQAHWLFRRFKILAAEPHYFPIRFFKFFKVGGISHKLLDRYCGTLLYYLLEKPTEEYQEGERVH